MSNIHRTYRLLIVDDDETDRRLYGWLLERQAPGACQIEAVADGAAGIAALRARQFDCILLDFSLPDVTGLEFLNDALANGELPCAVVLITGHGNEAIAVEAMKLGVQDYLVKDHVNEGRLWRAIERAVSQRELRQRLAHSMRALIAANANLEQETAARQAAEVAARAATDAAAQAGVIKSEFVAMVTGELRARLHRILRDAQSLRFDGGLSSRQNEQVGSIMREGRHLFGMIERALHATGIDAAPVALNPARLAVGDLTEDCIASIGPLAAERGLSLRLVRAHDAPRQIVADPVLLRQVLLTLLANAIKFTLTGGVELRVLASDSPGAPRIEVADTGPGLDDMPPDRLFQDRERPNGHASSENSNLRLATAARFVGLMGGAIGYLANPGGGSIFWLELPPAEAASGKRRSPAEGGATNHDGHAALSPAAAEAIQLTDAGRDGFRGIDN